MNRVAVALKPSRRNISSVPVVAPAASGPQKSRLLALAQELATYLCLAAIAVAFQWLAGAFHGAFSAHSDEGSHYLTALMIRDYLASGFNVQPIDFARDYYLHYPRMAFGLWPPLFHLATAVWMMLFGTGRVPVLLMMACITGLWGFVLYRQMVRYGFGLLPALASAVVLISLPITQSSTMALMLDVPVALLMTLAAARYGRYLVTGGMRDAAIFGILASLAILVKYNALALALMPPVAVVLSRRFSLIKRASFWLPLLIVTLLVGPWYLAMSRLVVYAAEPGKPWTSIVTAAWPTLYGLFTLAGPTVLGLGIAGAILTFKGRERESKPSIEIRQLTNPFIWASALLVSILLFHAVIYPFPDIRYLMPAAPAMLLLSWSVLDMRWRAFHSGLSWYRRFALCGTAILFIPYSLFSFSIPAKDAGSYVEAANILRRASTAAGSVILVSSDARGEGALVSELAMRERGSLFVVRASKLLVSQRLMGNDYRLLYETPEQLMGLIDNIPIAFMAIESTSAPAQPHERLLEETIARVPSRLRMISEVAGRSGGSIRLYQVTGNENRSMKHLEIDMGPTLGANIAHGSSDVDRCFLRRQN